MGLPALGIRRFVLLPAGQRARAAGDHIELLGQPRPQVIQRRNHEALVVPDEVELRVNARHAHLLTTGLELIRSLQAAAAAVGSGERGRGYELFAQARRFPSQQGHGRPGVHHALTRYTRMTIRPAAGWPAAPESADRPRLIGPAALA